MPLIAGVPPRRHWKLSSTLATFFLALLLFCCVFITRFSVTENMYTLGEVFLSRISQNQLHILLALGVYNSFVFFCLKFGLVPFSLFYLYYNINT